MPRGRYIWDRDLQSLVPSAEFYARKCEGVTYSDIPAPMIVRDSEPYRSTITGELIGGRRQHRDHLKAHGCIELGNEMPTHRPIAGPSPGEVAADIKRSMEDDNLRAEAVAASTRAKAAVPSV